MKPTLSLAAAQETEHRPPPVTEAEHPADRANLAHWTNRHKSGFGRSVGGALLLELGLLVVLTAWVAKRPTPPQPAQPARVSVHMVTPPAPPVPVVTPSHIAPAPAPVISNLPVIAVAKRVAAVPATFQVPALPPPPAAPQSGLNRATLLQQYTAQLNAAIQSGLVVPGMVRAMGLHGVTTVEFRLTPEGRLLWANVQHSSGVPPIDIAALARVKATTYPAFPSGLPQTDTTFEIAVKLSTDRL